LRYGGPSGYQVANDSGIPHVIVQESGYTATTLECVSGVSCPTNKPIPLVAGWKLDVFDVDTDDGSPIRVLTVKSGNNKRIVTALHKNVIDPEFDSLTGGIDLIQGSLTFKSATFTNGGSSSPVTLACSSSPCRIQVHYCVVNTTTGVCT
jgi:hypothetical protein